MLRPGISNRELKGLKRLEKENTELEGQLASQIEN